MPNLSLRPPKMSLVKATDSAVVYANGKRIYLGKWGTEKAKQAYRDFIELWAAHNGQIPDKSPTSAIVSQLVSNYMEDAGTRLGPSDFGHCKTVAYFLVSLYRNTPVEKFGPRLSPEINGQVFVVRFLSR